MATAPIQRMALLSVNPWEMPGPFQPFSYAIHRIEAALRTAMPELVVEVFDHGERPIADWIDELERFQPDVVAGSAYVWSLPTLLAVAKALRERGHVCPFVLGGPSAREEMLALPPYRAVPEFVDALVVGEGELAVVELVTALESGRPLEEVSGLALHQQGKWRRTPESRRLDLSTLPSPYVMGLVPAGVSAHLETFRGCPLSCAFCQWGEMASDGEMSREALERELRAYQELGIESALIADAALNLNPRAFRNLLAADDAVGFFEGSLVECELYPTRFNDGHRRFLERANATVGVGLQSAEPDVVAGMSRIASKDFAGFVRDLKQYAEVTIELILGLPGDTPDGFRRSLDLALGLGCQVRVFQCLALPGALMSRRPSHLEMQFHPVTLEVQSATGWTPDTLKRMVVDVMRMRPAPEPPSDAFEPFAGRPLFPSGWTLSRSS